MGDPHSYITPDVIADFTTIRLEQTADNRVRVYGIQGRAARFVMELRGSYSGVMGLPLYEAGQLLERLGAPRGRNPY